MIEPLRAHKNTLSELSQTGLELFLTGQEISFWHWQAVPDHTNVDSYVSQDYEVMGYVISGQAELYVDGKVIPLKPGDSWVVPTGAPHAYRIVEPLTAIKVSHPPAGQIY
ncbi:MAG: cupin domain-containing protein [Leptolyngbyaceae cyanobacterium]